VTGPTRVFLVEDNPTIEMCLRDTLSTLEGVEVVHTAPTRTEAAQWLTQHANDWDLAVIDIFLREGHGFDVLRACAGRGARRAVILSNYTREPVRASAEALGADAVFDKTCEMDDFVAYCARFAAERQSHPA
jgi:DNA-binding NarL/FixJ family response regulator